jgi:hypothetical protein
VLGLECKFLLGHVITSGLGGTWSSATEQAFRPGCS